VEGIVVLVQGDLRSEGSITVITLKAVDGVVMLLNGVVVHEMLITLAAVRRLYSSSLGEWTFTNSWSGTQIFSGSATRILLEPDDPFWLIWASDLFSTPWSSNQSFFLVPIPTPWLLGVMIKFWLVGIAGSAL
jgi:hypothetical protein